MENYECLCVGSSSMNCLGNPFKKYKVEMIGCDMFVIHDEDDTAIVNLMTLKKLSKKEINLSEICWN